MENSLIIFAVAMSPFVVAAIVWRSLSATQGMTAGTSARVAMPPVGAVTLGWRGIGMVAAVALGIVVLVGSMSSTAALVMAAGAIAASVLIRARGAFEPRIDVASAEFDEQLRGFLDDAA